VRCLAALKERKKSSEELGYGKQQSVEADAEQGDLGGAVHVLDGAGRSVVLPEDFLRSFRADAHFFRLPGVAQSLHPGLSPLTPSAYLVYPTRPAGV
jgi:hypothetical protein